MIDSDRMSYLLVVPLQVIQELVKKNRLLKRANTEAEERARQKIAAEEERKRLMEEARIAAYRKGLLNRSVAYIDGVREAASVSSSDESEEEEEQGEERGEVRVCVRRHIDCFVDR